MCLVAWLPNSHTTRRLFFVCVHKSQPRLVCADYAYNSVCFAEINAHSHNYFSREASQTRHKDFTTSPFLLIKREREKEVKLTRKCSRSLNGGQKIVEGKYLALKKRLFFSWVSLTPFLKRFVYSHTFDSFALAL